MYFAAGHTPDGRMHGAAPKAMSRIGMDPYARWMKPKDEQFF